MADNLGPMAWLFLPENVLPQWQQKIAQMRRKSILLEPYNYTRCQHITTRRIFCTKCNFLQVLNLHIFRQ